jgi:alpha-galactosidase
MTAVLFCIMAVASVCALNDGKMRRPPMGWNSWNHFGCQNITETLFKQMADAMVSSGMKDAGYTYLNIDDCWIGARDANGYIGTNDFFTGKSLKTLADYVHAKGLKLGLYTSAGAQTCAQYPGSLGYEDKDIDRYTSWGIDYLKVDWCGINVAQNANPLGAYAKFRDAMIKYQNVNPMVLSVCCWGQYNVWLWGNQVGHLWRTTPDISLGWTSFTDIIDKQATLWQYAGPGGWNDPDMLEVGRGMSAEEDKSHFGMWCLLAAPLIAGNDVRNMTVATLQILTNSELIAVNQDSLGMQAQRVVKNGDLEVWARPLVGNSRAVGLFNRSASAQTMTVSWSDLDKWSAKGLPWPATKSATVRNMWTHADVTTGLIGGYSVVVPGHGLAALRLYDPTNPVINRPVAGYAGGIELNARSIRFTGAGPHAFQVLALSGAVLSSKAGSGNRAYSLSTGDYHGTCIVRAKTETSMVIRAIAFPNGASVTGSIQ